MTKEIEIVRKEAVRLENGMIDLNSVSFQSHKIANNILEEIKLHIKTNCTINVDQSHGAISYKGEIWDNQEIMLSETNKLFDCENIIDNGTGELTEWDAIDDCVHQFAIEIAKQLISQW
jgi:hypothetical protein